MPDDLPAQQFYREGEDFDEADEDFYEEPDKDVFAFERPVYGGCTSYGVSVDPNTRLLRRELGSAAWAP